MPSDAPTSNPLLTLLDVVDSPLLLFNPEGRVVFTNRAAKRMASRPGMALPGDPNVQQVVKQIGQNKIVLHLELTVEVNSDLGVSRLRCQFAAKPIAGLIAMAVSDVTVDTAKVGGEGEASEGTQTGRLNLQQIVSLISDDLKGPMAAVLAQSSDVPSQSGPPAFAAALQTLQEKVSRLNDLVTVFGEDVLIGDERMLLPEMVRTACEALSPLAQEQGARFILEGDRDDLPPVYGSRKLIGRALTECLNNAIQHSFAPGRGDERAGIRIGFQPSGHHLMLSIVNMGVLSAQTLNRHAASLFHTETLNQPLVAADIPKQMQIGLPLTHRILELHGGRLRIEDADGELSVMLELPTGAPLKNTHQLDLLQAQIYAEDLSTLMARGRKRSTT